jgi:hypothetical protein
MKQEQFIFLCRAIKIMTIFTYLFRVAAIIAFAYATYTPTVDFKFVFIFFFLSIFFSYFWRKERIKFLSGDTDAGLGGTRFGASEPFITSLLGLATMCFLDIFLLWAVIEIAFR